MIYKENRVMLGEPIGNQHFLTLNRIDYEIKEIDSRSPSGKSANSSLYIVFNQDQSEEKILKICNYPSKINGVRNSHPKASKRVKRFTREIEALKRVNESLPQRTVQLLDDGVIEIPSCGRIRHEFLFYIMEKADCDLQTYLSQNDVSTSQKIALFRDVVSDFKKIHDIGIYHRDIKPANFLMFGTTCKISDFGLAGYRGQDYIDGRERRIGPWGFLSPEAINRLYASRDRSINIDDSSDIFQLGLLFWYILNSEVPTGIFEKADMQVEAHSLDTIDQCFHILFAMMQFKKERRTSCQDVYTALSQLVV